MSSNPENLLALLPVTSLQYRDISRSEGTIPSSIADGVSTQAVNPSAGAIYTEEQMAQAMAKVRAETAGEILSRVRSEFEAKFASEQLKLVETLAHFKKERTEYYGRVESELVHLALAIAGKILHREAQVDRMLLAALARIAVENLQHRSNVVVRVRPEHCERWREYFQNHLKGSKVEVLEDSNLGASDCILETDLGTADVSVDAQLKEIERGFFDLLAQRPGN